MSSKFPKSYRLKSRKAIGSLFDNGKKNHIKPILMIYNLDDERRTPNIQVSFSVPKRKLKRAVDRNRIKRLMLEVLRKRIEELTKVAENARCSYNIMFIYQTNNELSYKVIEAKIFLLLDRFIKQVNKENQQNQ